MSDMTSENIYSSNENEYTIENEYTMDVKEISAFRFLDNFIYKLEIHERRDLQINSDYLAHKLAHHLYILKKTYKINHTFIISLLYTFRNNEILEKFLKQINAYKPEKSVYKKYFPYLDLSGNVWKSIKILSTDKLIIDYMKEYYSNIDERFDHETDISYQTFENSLKIVSQLRWSEEKFRSKLLNKKIKKLNVALIKEYILKENFFEEEYFCCSSKLWVRKTNKNTIFDSFYLPWMKPFLEEAVNLKVNYDKYYNEYIEFQHKMWSEEMERRENDDSSDWWDGIEPDFDWEDISDSDLRDSLRDLYD